VRSLELYDSKNKRHPGELEFFLVYDEPPLGGLNHLTLELDDAVKKEFGADRSVDVVPKAGFLDLKKNGVHDGVDLDNYVESVLATVQPIYSNNM
jgi:hypothetical protein